MSCNNSFIVCKPKACSCNSNASISTCPMTELVKNGGFEELFLPTPGGAFVHWTFESITDPGFQFFDGDFAYEGLRNVTFNTDNSAVPIQKIARIFQNVPVTPGSLLQLSFAEWLLVEGRLFEDLDVVARVYYGDATFDSANQTDLIRIDIDYDEATAGYTFHQKVATNPVPCNVYNVTVEFIVIAFDAPTSNDNDTEWLLDGVSLRAVSPICSC